MKKQKLDLNKLEVKSFVTELDSRQESRILGGESLRSCPRGTCPV